MLPGAGPVLRPLSTLAIVAIERTLLPLRARRVDLAAVVARPLVRIGQQGVGGGDLLDAPLGLRFARVQVGVVLLRQLAVGATDLVFRRAPRDAPHLKSEERL